MKTFLTRLKKFLWLTGKSFKKIKLPKGKIRRQTLKITITILALIILIIAVYAVGIYKLKWSRYGTRTMAKIIPYPAVFVGVHIIPVSEFYEQKAFILHFYQETGSVAPSEEELDRKIIDQLVEQKLIDLALKKERIYISAQDVEDEYKKIVEQNQGEENVKKMLKDLYKMDVNDFKILMKDKLKAEKFRNEALVSAHVYHILIKVPEGTKDNKDFGDKAWEIINQLKAGGNFEELAKKLSQDEASKDKGGDLGFLQRGSLINGKPMSKEFENGVFSLEMGKFSAAPVLTEWGFHVFFVSEKRGKIDKSYADWLSETKNNTKIIKFLGK